MTYKSIVEKVLVSVKYKDWKFKVHSISAFSGIPEVDDNGDLLLWVEFMAPDNVTGKLELQQGRKWLIEANSRATQIVQCAWLAVQRAEMHEIAEQFSYKGAMVFNRHLDVDALVDISDKVV